MIKQYKSKWLFPELIQKGEAKFKSWSENNNTTKLYRLDWSKKDSLSFNKYVTSEMNQKFNKLPVKWEEWLQSFIYAIPDKYLDEIHNQTENAIHEMDRSYPFDTVIREICYDAAIAHVSVAFNLIADCVYAPNTNYFYRGDDKVLISHALLYRFWIGQTGSGLYKEHSNFDELKKILNFSGSYAYRLGEKLLITTFLNDIDEFEKEYCNAITKRHTDNPVPPGQPA